MTGSLWRGVIAGTTEGLHQAFDLDAPRGGIPTCSAGAPFAFFDMMMTPQFVVV